MCLYLYGCLNNLEQVKSSLAVDKHLSGQVLSFTQIGTQNGQFFQMGVWWSQSSYK